MSDAPWLWLIAGPNGAGKSTYAPNLAADVEEIVRPDELAYRLSHDAPESAALGAGRLAIQAMMQLLAERRSFAVETTLSGRFHLQVVARAKAQGGASVWFTSDSAVLTWRLSGCSNGFVRAATLSRHAMSDGGTNEASKT